MAQFDPFRAVLEKATDKGKNTGSLAGRRWLQRQIKQLVKKPNQIMRLKDRMTTRVEVGKMYLFRYAPKTANKLMYYDRYPLVFPIKRGRGGFIGLNLHYLSPKMRMIFLAKLMSNIDINNIDDNDEINVSYNKLKNSARLKAFRPCIKLYLKGRVETPFLKINAKEWEMATILPLDRFQKSADRKVWADSRKIIG